jgi:hypothetical protein
MPQSSCLIFALVALGLLGAAPAPSSGPAAADLASLERSVVLPKGAHPLKGYARFYWVIRSNADAEVAPSCSNAVRPPPLATFPLVRGRYLSPSISRKPAGVSLSGPTESFCGGGCNQVDLIYDPRNKQVISIGCNGPL